MAKFLIEDIRIGVTEGGIACGPVSGNVVAEMKIRNPEENSVLYYGITEVDGIPNFIKSEESFYDFQIKDDPDDEAGWQKVYDANVREYEDYWDIYDNLADPEAEHSEDVLIWKLLACFVRCPWEDVDGMKKACIGKFVEDIDIPVCDMEQEYLDDLEEIDEDDDE